MTEAKVIRAERKLANITRAAGVTDDGYNWLETAIDPFHDKFVPLKGYPDTVSASSVVQLVKQTGKIRWRRGDRLRNVSRDHQAPLERGSSVQTASSACGSRHRVSAKILTEPPAVLTYCTLPPAIQL